MNFASEEANLSRYRSGRVNVDITKEYFLSIHVGGEKAIL